MSSSMRICFCSATADVFCISAVSPPLEVSAKEGSILFEGVDELSACIMSNKRCGTVGGSGKACFIFGPVILIK